MILSYLALKAFKSSLNYKGVHYKSQAYNKALKFFKRVYNTLILLASFIRIKSLFREPRAATYLKLFSQPNHNFLQSKDSVG